MVTCRICNAPIGDDHRRKYCDNHREWCGGEWRQKHYIRRFYQKNKKKYSVRITRITGTGFSEHMVTDRKTGKPNFIKERIRVRKEKRRIGI